MIRVHVGPEIVQREIRLLLIVLIPAVVFRLDIVEAVQFARPELQIGGVEIRHDQEHDLVEIRQPAILLVDAEAIRVAAQDRFLAWHILRNAPRAARDDLVRTAC